MAGFTTTTNQHLIREEIWSNEIKEVLQDDLMAKRFVRMLDFPDGDTLTIPSIGEAEAQDYAEGQSIKYTAMDTGEYQFVIDQYKSSATYITEKMKQDSYKAAELQARFVPEMTRALAVEMEKKILRVGPDNQTALDNNTINDARHRFVGSGTNETMTLEDFHRARYALRKANVPMSNLIAIVDPTVAYHLSTQNNVLNLLSPSAQWQSVVNESISNGMQFKFNIAGFDVYESQYLKLNTGSEAIDGVTAALGVNNLFFSAAGGIQPIVGAIRQSPKVDYEYNKDRQRDEWVVTCRYGFDL